jgi:AAA domain
VNEIPDRQDALNAFAHKYLMPEPKPNGNGPQKAASAATYAPTDEDVLQAARKARNAAKFASLYVDGDLSAYDGDDSRADLALASVLAFYTQDPAQIARLIGSSALMRTKWNRRDYQERTIKRALDNVRDTYNWHREASEAFHSSVPRDGVADERKTLLFKTARQVAEETPAEVEWIARPWSAKGAITEIDGKVKAAGKTTFVSHKIAAIVDGKPFMGEPTTKTKVVWLTEQSPATFRKVLERANLTDRDDVIVVHWHDAMGMEWADVARAATGKAVEIGAGLLVVDTLGQFAGIKGDGENNAGAAQEAMEPLQEAAAKGLAVEFTRHERKGGGEVGESGRGSSAFGGAVDVIMTLRRGEGNTRPSVRVVEALSRFDETPDKVVVELSDQGYRNLGTASAFAEKEAQDAIGEILPAKAEHALATADVLDPLSKQGVKRTVGTDALARLTELGTIERLGKGKKGSPYRYYKPTPEDRPGDSESPDPLVHIHSSTTPTYIRTKEKTLSSDLSPSESTTPEQLQRIGKLAHQGMREDLAREQVLGEGWEEP